MVVPNVICHQGGHLGRYTARRYAVSPFTINRVLKGTRR